MPLITLLLVEDNELNRDMLSRRLERKGYVIQMAADGAQGVSMAMKLRPALILMDLSLPVMDGWEAIRRLNVRRRLFFPAHCLTILVTGGEGEE